MENEKQKSNFIKSDVSSRLIHEAILNDEKLKWLYQQKAKVYETIVPTVIMVGGQIRPQNINENEHPLLKNINSHIAERKLQIVESINGC